jgi:type IV secretion system protein VirB8
VNANYRKVALFSGDTARNSYLQTMQVANPQSPLMLYPRTTIIDVRVKSVSPVGPNATLVRFETVRTDEGAQPQPPSAWVAVVHYRYSGAPMKLEDRFINPLGFQVTGYRKDPEALPPPAVPVAGQPATPPTSTGPAGYYGGAATQPPQPDNVP